MPVDEPAESLPHSAEHQGVDAKKVGSPGATRFLRTFEVAQHADAVLGETPLWDAVQQRLIWIDIDRPTLHALDPVTGLAEAWEQDCAWLGSQALAVGGKRLLARDLSLHLARPGEKGSQFAVISQETHPTTRLNDGRVDRYGALWIGTMDNDLWRPIGGLYRVDAGGSVERVFGDVIVSNGIAFAPDGRHMWFTDTRRHVTWKIGLNEDGTRPVSREVFADYRSDGARPDGACVDAEGCLWQAIFAGGRVVRYAPDGRIDREIALPVTNPTCPCFGGLDYRTLFVTTATKFLTEEQRAREPLAGSVFAIEGAGQGVPENVFGDIQGRG